MTRQLQRGASAASPAAARIAEHLQAAYPGDLRVLAGLRLAEAGTGHGLTLDLVALTPSAAVVGVEPRPGVPAAAATTPQVAALAVARMQHESQIVPPLPVYAFWLGPAVPEGYAGGAPALLEPAAVQRFIEHASAQPGLAATPGPQAADRLAERLLAADIGPDGASPVQPAVPAVANNPTAAASSPPVLERKQSPDPFRRVLRELRDLPGQLDATLREHIRQPLPWRRGEPVRPADVREHLEAAMLAPENLLEDAAYLKIVPNEYVVELNPQTYERNFRLIERRVTEQWQQRLLEALNTANQRQGRKEFQFGGRVQIQVRPGAGLAEDEVRIRSRIVPDPAPAAPAIRGCLELLANGQRWQLLDGIHVMGRDHAADIHLDPGRVQDRPLVSGQHAHVLVEPDRVWLYDGSPSGRASTNGTFVNGRPVTTAGRALNDGDLIVLAPLNPQDPRPDSPGAVALRFHLACSE